MTDFNKSQEHELICSVLSGKLHQLTLDLWQQTRMDWGFVTDRLSSRFRRERSLGATERRFVAELLYCLVRNIRRIDMALELGGLQMAGKAPDFQRLLACLVLEYGVSTADAAQRDSQLDWRRVASVDAAIATIRPPAHRIAMRHSLPDFLAAALVADYGDQEAEALAIALNQRAPMSIRANTLKNSREELAASLLLEGIETVPGMYGRDTLHVTTRTNLFGLSAFQQGGFEAQDEGSQLIAELVAPPPKALVLDYCAGAGGKTLALAAALLNKGRVLASDVDKRKLKELRRRAKRAAASNIQVISIDPESGSALAAPLEKRLNQVSRVLVDAPCTGLGALRRNPESRWRLQEADFERLSAIQIEIARRALGLVAPGGRMIYATCTLLRKENQEVVSGLLAGRSDLEIVSPREVWGAKRGDGLVDSSGQFLTTTPHHHGCDGFFAAVIRRTSS